MKNRRNYYRILHVQPEAPAAVIKASYRTLMQRLRLHPDLGGDHEAAALINEAYATLMDPARRADYDRTLHAHRSRGSGEAAPAPAPEAAPAREANPAAAEAARESGSCSFCGIPSLAAGNPSPESSCSGCGSALFPARRHHADGNARRALERVPRTMPIAFRCSQSPARQAAGTTEDVSLNGMGFRAATSVAPGERLRIDCEFCSAVAVVRSLRPDASQRLFHIGVEFLTLHIRLRKGGLVSVSV